MHSKLIDFEYTQNKVWVRAVVLSNERLAKN